MTSPSLGKGTLRLSLSSSVVVYSPAAAKGAKRAVGKVSRRARQQGRAGATRARRTHGLHLRLHHDSLRRQVEEVQRGAQSIVLLAGAS